MAVASTTRKQQFTLDAIEDEFTFTFRALTSAPEDIKCIVTASGVDTDLVYTTQFTVAINSDGVGGTVTLVSPSSVGSGTLTVYRETTNLQASDYDDYNQFPSDTVETDFDIRTLVAQEQTETINRAIKFPVSSSADGELLNPSSNASKYLAINSLGTGIEYVTGTTPPILTGGTLTGVINLGEGADTGTIGLELDAALSSVGRYSGITEGGTAGATLVFGDICQFFVTDSRWYLCDANTAAGSSGDSRGKIGICVQAASSAGATKMLLWGKIRASVLPTLTVGAPVYISETAGDVVVTQPVTADVVIRLVGFGNTSSELFFCPSPDHIVHT